MEEISPKLEARLRAMEFLIINLYGIENRRRGRDADRILNEHKELLIRMRQQERGARAGSSDSNVYREVERLLSEFRAVS